MLAWVALVLATAAWACSSPPKAEPVAQQALVDVAQRTLASGSARTRVLVETKGVDGVPDGRTEVATGLLDFASGRSSFALRLAAPGPDPGPPSTTEVVTDGTTSYIRISPTAPWARVDAAVLQGIAPSITTGGTQPAVGLLAGASGEITRTEPGDQSDGSTRFDFLVPLNLAPEVAGAPVPGPRLVPASAWVDADGRLLRLETRVDIEKLLGEGTEASGTVVSNYELYDYGAEVAIDVPASADVPPRTLSTISDLVEFLQGATGSASQGAGKDGSS